MATVLDAGRPPRLIHATDAEISAARRRLHAKAVVIIALALVSYYGLVLADVGIVVRLLSAPVLVVALTTVGTGIMHDANHSAFSRSRRVNRLVGYALDLIGGSSWLWRFRHNTLHHVHTNVVGVDVDIDQAPFARLAPQQPWRRWHRYQHLYLWFLYGILAVRWFLFADFVSAARHRVGSRSVPGRRYGRNVSVLVAGKLVHLGWALVIPLLLHPWWAVLGFYLACSWGVGFMLAVIFQLAHCVDEAAVESSETGQRDRDTQLHQLRTTVDIRCGIPALRPLASFVMGGLDYQVEHHLAPALPHTIYPALADRVAANCASRGLPYLCHRSFTSALRSHVRWLKRMGAEPAG